ncbi:MAG: tRNA pseudouridine synthase A, partial [Christensenellales bacterium]
ITQVDNNFHARFTSKKKTYEYLFYVGNDNIPVYDKFATHIGYNVNIELMKDACEYFKGEHNFSAFCASNTNVVDKVRTIYNIEIIDINEKLYKLVITGNGFLYNMVRIIMGTLVEVGRGRIPINYVSEIIKNQDRSKAGRTMPSLGLYLKKVEY